MSEPFSASTRATQLDALARDTFDVLVIGGGITGAGTARDAAMRGLRVALVERDDFASGTSSRSSRLVHGGIRYLEHGQLRLVFEASRERRTLLAIAPHLVRPLQFLWPVYEHARISQWKLRAGLLLYDALALFRNIANHRSLSAQLAAALEPTMRHLGLEGGAIYFDAATDDARLTLANARAAHEAGAVVLNHVAVRELIVEGGIVRGARAHDCVSGRDVTIGARIVVNATGPWSDSVRRLADPAAPPSVRGTKGAHVAVPRERVGNHAAVTLLSPIDGRVMFVLPAGRLAIIGTTDTDFAGAPDDVRATPEDVAYLLRSANAFFPAAHLTPADVVSAWAGIRPLVGDGTRPPDAVSREHVVARTAPGLISVTGGKLTTYRVMARDVVDQAQRMLGAPVRHAPTQSVPLPGGAMASFDAELDAARERVSTPELADHLVHRYGTEWRDVWALAERDESLASAIAPPFPDIVAELHWAVSREMALTLADLLVRRLHLAFELRDHAVSIAPAVASTVAPLLGWSREEAARQVAGYAEEVGRMF